MPWKSAAFKISCWVFLKLIQILPCVYEKADSPYSLKPPYIFGSWPPDWEHKVIIDQNFCPSPQSLMSGSCEWAAEIPQSDPGGFVLHLSPQFCLPAPTGLANLKNGENKVCGCLGWTRAAQSCWLGSSTGFEISQCLFHLSTFSNEALWNSWMTPLMRSDSSVGTSISQRLVSAQGMLQDVYFNPF